MYFSRWQVAGFDGKLDKLIRDASAIATLLNEEFIQIEYCMPYLRCGISFCSHYLMQIAVFFCIDLIRVLTGHIFSLKNFCYLQY